MLTHRPVPHAARSTAPAVLACAVVGALALPGCVAPGPSRAPDSPTVVAMSEDEFDIFAGRIAQQLRRVAADGRYPAPVGIAYPEVVAEPDLRPAARALAERLSEGLNDRLAGAALVAEGRSPAAWQSRMELRRDPASADTQQLEFAVIDSRAGVEVAREKTTFVPQPHALTAAEPPIELGNVPPAPEPAPPSEAPRAATASPPTRAAPKAATASPPAARAGAAPAPQPAAPAPRRAEPPPPTAAAARMPDERSTDQPERARKLRINGDPRELAATVARQLPRYRSQTADGERGEVVFLDDDSRAAFRLQGQGISRSADGRLRVELELRAHDDEQDAKLRVIFLDGSGEVIDATPVIPYLLVNTYTSTIVVPAADARAERYIVLIQED